MQFESVLTPGLKESRSGRMGMWWGSWFHWTITKTKIKYMFVHIYMPFHDRPENLPSTHYFHGPPKNLLLLRISFLSISEHLFWCTYPWCFCKWIYKCLTKYLVILDLFYIQPKCWLPKVFVAPALQLSICPCVYPFVNVPRIHNSVDSQVMFIASFARPAKQVDSKLRSSFERRSLCGRE